jgi:TM2 domain-containing membrane protein YozV
MKIKMKNMRTLVVIILSVFFNLTVFGTAQIPDTITENGSRDVFVSETQPQFNPNYQYRNPGLAWFFSYLLPGGGQFYNGDIGKGVGFLVSGIVGYSVMAYGFVIAAFDGGIGIFIIGACIGVGASIWSQIDAPHSAIAKNRANNYLSWNLGNGSANLTLRPELNLSPTSFGQGGAIMPTYGIGLKLKF